MRERASRLLVISNRDEDIAFGKALAEGNGLHFGRAVNRDQLRHALATYPDTFVLWDAEHEASYEAIGQILPKYARARRTFALTDKTIIQYPHLFNYPVCSHHLLRRFSEPLPKLAHFMMQAAEHATPMGIEKYFPERTLIKRLVITRSSQKMAATEAIENYLTKQGVRGRLSSLVAQSLDELILNALFHATVRKGKKPGADFALPAKEQVEVELASTDHYMAACVTDHFGTLKRDNIVAALADNKAEGGGEGTNLGIGGIYRAGLSLLFTARAGHRTQAMLFFERVTNFKEFRGSFRFFSLDLIPPESPKL